MGRITYFCSRGNGHSKSFELASDNQEVLLHDFSNFVETIHKALSTKETLEKRALERVQKDFSIEEMARKTINVYEDIYENN